MANAEQRISVPREPKFPRSRRKSSHLYGAIIGFWLLTLFWTAPPLYLTFVLLQSPIAKGLFLFVGICLLLFWLYGIYNIFFVLFYLLGKATAKSHGHDLTPGESPLPRVGVIYTTYNDFQREAALTCLQLHYPNYHFFVLDVSTDPEMRHQIDVFLKEFPNRVTLIRLPPRPGFKARSLNDALTNVVKDYELFALCDADTRLPPNFLARAVPNFAQDERLAFIQANHVALDAPGGEKFAQDFAPVIGASWYYQQGPRNRYGLLMCMGHGVVIRRAAWEEVGGFPEIVQEDTAFTLRLREHGYYGHFAQEILCSEEFPPDLTRYRRRYFRLVQADFELLFRHLPRFFRAKGISWTEKIDILLRTARVPGGTLGLPFFLMVAALIPLAEEGDLSGLSLDATFGVLSSPGFIGVTLVAAFGPFYPFLLTLGRNPLRLARLLSHSMVLHYPLLLVSLASLFDYLVSGRATFVVTGGGETTTTSQPQKRQRSSPSLPKLQANHPLVAGGEVVLGLLLGFLGIVSESLVLVGIALSLWLALLVGRYGWGNRVLSLALYLPFVLVAGGTAVSLAGIYGAQSQYLGLALLALLLVF